MKNYKFDKKRVIENKTGFVIKKCKSNEEAKALSKRLNGGHGFNGETPRFFIKLQEQA